MPAPATFRSRSQAFVFRLELQETSREKFSGTWANYRCGGRNRQRNPTAEAEAERVAAPASDRALEGGADRKPEGLARLTQHIGTVVQLLGLGVGKVACAARGEHTAGNQVLPRKGVEQLQRVDRVVNTEGSIDDGHHYVQLAAGRHARDIISSRNGVDGGAEVDLLAALAGPV